MNLILSCQQYSPTILFPPRSIRHDMDQSEKVKVETIENVSTKSLPLSSDAPVLFTDEEERKLVRKLGTSSRMNYMPRRAQLMLGLFRLANPTSGYYFISCKFQ